MPRGCAHGCAIACASHNYNYSTPACEFSLNNSRAPLIVLNIELHWIFSCWKSSDLFAISIRLATMLHCILSYLPRGSLSATNVPTYHYEYISTIILSYLVLSALLLSLRRRLEHHERCIRCTRRGCRWCSRMCRAAILRDWEHERRIHRS